MTIIGDILHFIMLASELYFVVVIYYVHTATRTVPSMVQYGSVRSKLPCKRAPTEPCRAGVGTVVQTVPHGSVRINVSRSQTEHARMPRARETHTKKWLYLGPETKFSG